MKTRPRCMVVSAFRWPYLLLSSIILIFTFAFENRYFLFESEAFKNLGMLYLFLTPMEYGIIPVTMPVLAVLNYVYPNADRIRSFIDFSSNTAKASSALKTVKYCVRNSFLSVLIGCMFYLLYIVVFSTTNDVERFSHYSIGKSMEMFATTWRGLPYILEVTLRLCISSSIWSIFSLTIAFCTQNSRSALLTTFIVFLFLDNVLRCWGLADWRPFFLMYTWIDSQGNILWRYLQNLIAFCFLVLSFNVAVLLYKNHDTKISITLS